MAMASHENLLRFISMVMASHEKNHVISYILYINSLTGLELFIAIQIAIC
jgi:hypothetical protein